MSIKHTTAKDVEIPIRQNVKLQAKAIVAPITTCAHTQLRLRMMGEVFYDVLSLQRHQGCFGAVQWRGKISLAGIHPFLTSIFNKADSLYA